MLRTGCLGVGKRIYHLNRKTYYQVRKTVTFKTSPSPEEWVEGYLYECEESGRLFARPFNLFGGFIEVPQESTTVRLWKRIKKLFS